MRVFLLTTLANVADSERIREYEACMRTNSQNAHIEKLIVFFEHGRPSTQVAYDWPDGTVVLEIEERPTFKMLFDYANRNLSGRIALIANADIYFDEASNQ